MNNRSVLKNYPLSSKLKSIFLLLILLLTLSAKIVGSVLDSLKQREEQQSISIFIKDQPTAVNPLYAQSNLANAFLSKAFYRSLVKYNPESKSYESDLADFVISEDSKEFIFRIKEGNFWSDGNPISLADVLFTYKNIIQNSQFTNKALQSQFNKIEINQSRDNEITVTLPAANSFFIEMFTLGILPKHIYKNIAFEDLASHSDIEVTSTSVDIKEINESPNWQRFKFATANQNFIVDVSPEPQIDNYNLILDDSQKLSEGYSQYTYTLPQYTALFLNLENSFLAKKIHRQAINDAVNKKDLQAKLPDDTIISKPFFQFENITSIPKTSFELIRSNLQSSSEFQALSQSGNIKLSLIASKYQDEKLNNKTRVVIEHIRENLARIGIEVVIQLYDFEVFKQILVNKEYDLALFGHDLGANFDSYSFWHSSQRFKNGLNVSSYFNPLTDNLLENLRRENNQSKKIEFAREINSLLAKDIPAVFLFTTKKHYFIDNKIKNRKILNNYSHPSDIFYDLEAWQKIN